ncbi:MAG TPA: nitroreductase [Noviherbaspirillum sp.]|uniref:nitroreductase n=1 Tax=Noviherbaspirillum sp. TaxID=1926288 RepID=UPI002B462BC5|nr:nitroreductase [Noviherbaspirillum sp.]HJV88438.1 nitroreductase [Noviherbaspirillum sp.]
MKVSEAITTRRSVRGFLDKPVPPDLIRRVLRTASRAPSGGNLQPWHVHVVSGESMARLMQIMQQRVLDQPDGEATEYDIYPKSLMSPYRERRYKVGEDLYACLGIAREDKAGRKRQFARNFALFGAPMGLFCSIDRRMGRPQWVDLGMFLQTVMLLLREEGLDSCPQEAWSLYPQTMGDFLKLPEHMMLFCGLAIGYADPDAPANRLSTTRAELDEFVEFMD